MTNFAELKSKMTNGGHFFFEIIQEILHDTCS